ncbi:MAG TPA: cytochrome c3 family protein [Casimicrobiaceae bacterium]|nr:cytochrome c3 family protein [Casimicrobiaceae bacterium]
MNRQIVRALGVAFLFALSAGVQAQQANAAPGNCQRCHDAGLPLPETHPKVKGASIVECAACHASQAGQAKPYPLASRLHRAHVKVALDCTTCHAYAPGTHFAVLGHQGNLGALDAEQYEMVRKAMASWANSPWLAATHGNKQNLSCGACHQSQPIPDDNETVVNKQCVACHGNYDKLASLTRAKLKNPEINPHSSHLGPEIACTVCHQGHRESKPYCLNCHTNFEMPIPGAAAELAAPAAGK